MKKIHITHVIATSLLLFALALQSCVKDSATKTYTMFKPVYQSFAEVRANIKSNPSVAVTSPGKMFVLGNYIFLNEVDKGVHIIDNSDPSKPVNKYFINLPGNMDIAVADNILYADLYSDLVAIDITNPEAVQVKKIINNAFPHRRYSNGFVGDTANIITDWIVKDTTVDYQTNWNNGGMIYMDAIGLSNNASANTKAIGMGGSMARFALLQQHLYTVSNDALKVFNISQPENPLFKNMVSLRFGIETIFPFKNNLFIGSSTGMFIYGTVNPEQPNMLGQFNHSTACDPVVADDNFAYVTLRSGSMCQSFNNQLDVINVQQITSPYLIKSYKLTNPHGLSKSGNTLFVCDGAAGLKVFDATNPADLKPLKTITGMDTYDVIAHNNIAIVVAKDGLYQYDYSTLSDIKLLSKISISKN